MLKEVKEPKTVYKMVYRRNENFEDIKKIWEEEESEDIDFLYAEDKMEDFKNK